MAVDFHNCIRAESNAAIAMLMFNSNPLVLHSKTSYHMEYLASASLSYEWNNKFGTYYEVAGRFNTQDPRGDVVALGTGFTYKLRKDLQLDAGVNFGVTPASDRINQFVGLSARF